MQGLKTGPEGCWILGRESFLKHGNNAFERESGALRWRNGGILQAKIEAGSGSDPVRLQVASERRAEGGEARPCVGRRVSNGYSWLWDYDSTPGHSVARSRVLCGMVETSHVETKNGTNCLR